MKTQNSQVRWDFIFNLVSVQFSSVQSLSRIQLFATPWAAACQASLSITNSESLLKLMSIEHLAVRAASCYPTIASSVIPFSSCLPSFPGSGNCVFCPSWLSDSQFCKVVEDTSDYVECACSYMSVYAVYAQTDNLSSYNEAFFSSGFICISGEL